MRELERAVPRIRERLARLEQLTESIEGLSNAVNTLTATYNKGRGAIWVIGGFGVVVGIASTYLARRFGA